MPPPTHISESILDEIDLEIVDPFGDDGQQYMQTTRPISRGMPPPQHGTKYCVDEAYLRIRQNAQ
jgi:hypothetical protein